MIPKPKPLPKSSPLAVDYLAIKDYDHMSGDKYDWNNGLAQLREALCERLGMDDPGCSFDALIDLIADESKKRPYEAARDDLADVLDLAGEGRSLDELITIVENKIEEFEKKLNRQDECDDEVAREAYSAWETTFGGDHPQWSFLDEDVKKAFRAAATAVWQEAMASR